MINSNLKFSINWSMLFASLLVITEANSIEYSDPFYQSTKQPCHKLHDNLVKQLQAWQFKGLTRSSNQQSPKIWLTSKQHWIMASSTKIPIELLPWQIESISPSHIIWHAKLPDYCHKTIYLKMPFKAD